MKENKKEEEEKKRKDEGVKSFLNSLSSLAEGKYFCNGTSW